MAPSFRQQWPVLVVAVLALLGWADLRARVVALEEAEVTPAPAPEPQPSQEECPMTGTLPQAAVRGVVGRNGRDVFGCYESHGEGRGTLDLTLRVDREGVVQRVMAAGTLATQAALAQCAQEAAWRWRFPAPEGDGCAEVAVPFLLGATPAE
ncbi:MAG: hypothetical protein SangKO_021090 [Sandaracinaceae bacterium]